MISIVYSTHKDTLYNKMFQEHLKKSIGVKDFEILEYQNNNEFSLAQIYNRGISESKFNIVVCIHNDIKLETGWGKKLLQDFENSPDFAIIGKAGSCYFPKSGIYWERMQQTMVGQVYHHPDGQKKWLSKYSAKLPYLIPVVTIDGLFISFDKDKIKHTFDESIGKFHFYDHGFCVPNYLDGIKIGVTSSFDITHQSVGRPNQEFFESKDKFLEKYQSILPLDLKPEKIFVQEIKEKPLKNIGKVAVVILTKSKVEMLYECVKSFYDNCNPKIFDVFIGDTGSTDEEKKWIKENILPLGNIKFIEYDYYNFAKINNDVVVNHITNDYEFLLFCNNDIKLLNNVIYGMLNIFKNHNDAGSVGCRLHFEDNTIQHDGIIGFLNQNKQFIVTHNGLNSYYNYMNGLKKVFGNTGALLMMRKKIFEKCNMFNENYETCFEDVELNCSCTLLGCTNYYDGSLVAYHYESQTRGKTKENQENEIYDYRNNLIPFIHNNFEKLKKVIYNAG